jgi:hypothetical protein
MNSGTAEGGVGSSCCSMLSCYSFDHQAEKNDLKHEHCKEFEETNGVITIHASEAQNERQHNGQKTNITLQEEFEEKGRTIIYKTRKQKPKDRVTQTLLNPV